MAARDPARAELDASLERFRPRIRQHIRGLVHDRADAEDLTQETLLRAHRRLEALQSPDALGGWLYRIATNVCIDFLRPASRRGPEGSGGSSAEQVAESEVAADVPGLEELVDHADMSACGEELLARIPPAYRQVLVLHDFRGHTAAEIARDLRCTTGAVKIRLHRARAQFRALLEECCDLFHDERGVLVGAPKRREARARRRPKAS